MGETHLTRVLEIEGTRLLLDGKPFPFQGVSFFNAIYNPTFNQHVAERLKWLQKFRENGINALRVWCQWDFEPPFTFVDLSPDHTMYTAEGDVRDDHFQTLVYIIEAADSLDMVVEVTLFSQEKRPNLPIQVQERGARSMAQRLLPYRNVILQIWNEKAVEVPRYYAAIKAIDPERIVTNSPGGSSVLGDEEHNRLLDLLTPHTVRRGVDNFWEVAPRQIASLMEQYEKPVIDDEPARTGTVKFGGIEGGTRPEQHIEQVRRVRASGAYHTYHHDMFQTGYGSPAIPPAGIPDPDFSPFHRQVFDFLRENQQW
jgi:hypothetical protein